MGGRKPFCGSLPLTNDLGMGAKVIICPHSARVGNTLAIALGLSRGCGRCRGDDKI